MKRINDSKTLIRTMRRVKDDTPAAKAAKSLLKKLLKQTN